MWRLINPLRPTRIRSRNRRVPSVGRPCCSLTSSPLCRIAISAHSCVRRANTPKALLLNASGTRWPRRRTGSRISGDAQPAHHVVRSVLSEQFCTDFEGSIPLSFVDERRARLARKHRGLATSSLCRAAPSGKTSVYDTVQRRRSARLWQAGNPRFDAQRCRTIHRLDHGHYRARAQCWQHSLPS